MGLLSPEMPDSVAGTSEEAGRPPIRPNDDKHRPLRTLTDPILARIGITRDEWNELRHIALDLDKRPSQLLAELVRKYLKGRK